TVNASTELQQVTTPSLDALRKYSQAVQIMEANSGTPRAIALLEEAVRLDTGFAMAWRKLGVAYDGTGDMARSQAARARAFANKDRLTERERYLTIGTYYGGIDGGESQAIAAYRALLEGSPNDGWALNNIGILYMRTRQYTQAEQMLDHAVTTDSGNYAATLNLMSARINLGKIGEATALTEATERRFKSTPGLSFMVADVRYAAGDLAGAIRDLESGAAIPGADPGMVLAYRGALSQYTLLQGRLNAVTQAGGEIEAGFLRQNRPEAALAMALLPAQIQLRFHNDRPGAISAIDRALAKYPWSTIPTANRPYLTVAYLLAQAGAVDRARALLEENAKLQIPAPPGNSAYRSLVQGAIAISERRGPEAVRLVHDAINRGTCSVCDLPDLARAFEAAGQIDSAKAAWQAYVSTPEAFRINTDGVELAFAWQRLGLLYEEAGERDKARDAWGHLIDLWRNADPVLQPIVAEAKRHLTALSGEPNS
ncbi:MAG TPA: tetratricopeptide repeat protein, partial [Gemmatimonadales bacterium]|nr:tetratricopeptide repeat protein [Gemmatimonadales bacterium]